MFLGILLSIPYGIGHWMVFQDKKKGSLIPVGSFTLNYGIIIAFTLKILCYSIVVWLCIKYYWGILTVVPIIWLVSGFLARRIERLLYANSRLDRLEYHAQRFAEKYGDERASLYWNEAVPRWWIDIMSSKWKKEYVDRIGRYIKSADTTSLLFNKDKFKNIMQSKDNEI